MTTSDDLKEFFYNKWREQDGWVVISTKTHEDPWHETWFMWPKMADQVVAQVLLSNAQRAEVYYCPALYSKRISKKQYVIGSNVLWVDLDGNAPESGTSQAAVQPSERVATSLPGHEHWYWALDAFETDINVIENRNRALAIELQADTSGWDATQVLRVPYTTNYGYSKPDRDLSYPTKIEESSDRVYPLDSFREVTNFVPLMVSNLGEIPPLTSVLSELTWPRTFLPLFNKTAEELEPKNGERGKRSDALQQLGYITAESGGTDEQIFAVVSDANTRWKKYPESRSDWKKRLVDIVERARAKHPSIESDFSGLAGPSSKALPLVYGFADFLAANIKIEWLFENVLALMGFGVIFGPPGAGKTQFGIRMAMAVALGKSFLKWKNSLNRKAKVLFLSLEMNHPSLKYFLDIMKASISAEDQAILQEQFAIFPAGKEIPFDTPDGRKFLESLIETHKPEVIFIDSLSKAVFQPLTDEVVRDLQRYLAALRSRYGVSIYFIHHDRKATDKKRPHGEMDDMYGSRYISADADFVIGINKLDEDNAMQVTHSKLRLGPPMEPFAIHRTKDLDFVLGDLNDILASSPGGSSPGAFGEVFNGLFGTSSD